MIASLPMYDRPSTAAANDRFWALIRSAYGTGPATLERSALFSRNWTASDLVLSQTCGMPYRTGLRDLVTLVCTPDYGVRGCPPGYYKSYIIVRKDDPRRALADFQGARLARNSAGSQSGWAAIENHLQDHALDFSFADHSLDTGGHEASVRAVARGEADIAAIDAVTWTLLKRDLAEVSACRVLTATAPTPGLPFITARGTDPAPLRDALHAACDALPPRDRARLLLKGLVDIPAAAYLAVPTPRHPDAATN